MNPFLDTASAADAPEVPQDLVHYISAVEWYIIVGLVLLLGSIITWLWKKLWDRTSANRDLISENDKRLGRLEGVVDGLLSLTDEIKGLRSELKGDIKEFRIELKEDIKGLRIELKDDIGQTRKEMQDCSGSVKDDLKNLSDRMLKG